MASSNNPSWDFGEMREALSARDQDPTPEVSPSSNQNTVPEAQAAAPIAGADFVRGPDLSRSRPQPVYRNADLQNDPEDARRRDPAYIRKIQEKMYEAELEALDHPDEARLLKQVCPDILRAGSCNSPQTCYGENKLARCAGEYWRFTRQGLAQVSFMKTLPGAPAGKPAKRAMISLPPDGSAGTSKTGGWAMKIGHLNAQESRINSGEPRLAFPGRPRPCTAGGTEDEFAWVPWL